MANKQTCYHTRITEFDMTRGAAMLLVCLSHFETIYFANPPPIIIDFSQKINMIASPTFMAISGIMLGFLYGENQATFKAIRKKLIDRALFLLTVGHVLIGFAHLHFRGNFNTVLHWIFITDAIGVSVLTGCFLIGRMRIKGRLMLSIGMVVLTYLLLIFAHLLNPLMVALKAVLIGQLRETQTSSFVGFNLLPWSAYYLLASCLGENMALVKKRDGEDVMYNHVIGFGLIAILMALAVKLPHQAFKALASKETGQNLQFLLSVLQKYPPSPLYFLFFGGTGLCMLYALHVVKKRKLMTWLEKRTQLLGRNSLFVFILQYYVYWVILSVLRPSYAPWWLLYWLASIFVIFQVCKLWDYFGMNKYLSLRFIRVAGGPI